MSGPPPPPLPVPPGGDPNYTGALYAVTWVFWSLTTIFVAARIYTHARITKAVGWDDWVMLFSWAVATIESAFVTVSVSNGFGRHHDYLTLEQQSEAAKWQIFAEPPGILGPAISKVAVTMLIFKIMGPSTPGVLGLWILNIVVLVLSIVTSIVVFVRCKPVSADWLPIGDYTCWDPMVLLGFGLATAAASAFGDFVLALFPISFIWNLRLDLKRKITTCVLMGLGLVAGIVASIKTSLLYSLANTTDYTYANANLVMLVLVEINIIIVCACIPTLLPLYRRWTGQETTKGGSHSYGARGATPASDSWIKLRPGTDRSHQGKIGEPRITQTTNISVDWEHV